MYGWACGNRSANWLYICTFTAWNAKKIVMAVRIANVGHRCLNVSRAMPWVMRSAAGNLLMAAATEVPVLDVAIEVPALNVRIALRHLAQPSLSPVHSTLALV